MILRIQLVILLILLSILHGYTYHGEPIPDNKMNGPDFIENQGQWSGPQRFQAKWQGVQLFLEDSAITYKLESFPRHGDHGCGDEYYRSHAYRVQFLNSNEMVRVRGLDKKTQYHNYFLGSNPDQWKSHVPIYSSAKYEELYPGVDMHMYLREDELKYDFILQPGVHPDIIQMQYEGQENIKIVDGQLIIKTSLGEIIEGIPYAYQIIDGKEKTVPCHYILDNNRISFAFDKGFDPNFSLIIDPVLIFSTFSGSTGDNFGVTATYDESGHGYLAGLQFATGYPVTLGAYDSQFATSTFEPVDIVISKYTPTGNAQVYATYLGGTRVDVPHSIVVNTQNQLVLYGSTSSGDYPTTSNAYDDSFNGGNTAPLFSYTLTNGTDMVVTVFDESGSSLIGSTFIGGRGNDGINFESNLLYNYADQIRGEVITDGQDNILVYGMTKSNNFPTTPAAFDGTYNGGGSDAVILQLNADASELMWCTYFGGDGEESSGSLEIHPDGSIYFAGATTSRNIPTSINALNGSFRGGTIDGYVAALHADGSSLSYATYLGTNSDDLAFFVDIDLNGDIYVLGNSYGGTYPTTANVYANAGGVQYVHKLNPELSNTSFSTVFGLRSFENRLALNAFLVDECYRIYVSGWGGVVNQANNVPSSISGMVTTSDALFPQSFDGSDFYFIVFEPDAIGLEYATYFGANELDAGEHVDGGTSRFDDRGVIYQAVCAGCRANSSFPTTPGAFSNTNNSPNCNMALIKFDFQLDEIRTQAIVDPEPIGCEPFVVNFTNLSQGPIDSFYWDFGDGTFSYEENPTKTYPAGIYQVSMVGWSKYNCKPPDTTHLTVTVFEVYEEMTFDTIICPDLDIQFAATNQQPGHRYRWSDGSTNPILNVDGEGQYVVVTKATEACYVDTFNLSLFPDRDTAFTKEYCSVENVELSAPINDPGTQFEWSTGETTSSIIIQQEGNYEVHQIDENNCDQLAVINVQQIDSLLERQYDIVLCEGRTITLTAETSLGNASYRWDDGSTQNTRDIDDAGSYWVMTIPEEDTTCAFTRYFDVELETQPENQFFSADICPNQVLTLSVDDEIFEDAIFQWSDGSNTPTIQITEPGDYSLQISYPSRCARSYLFEVEQLPDYSSSTLYFPNAFSPNNDGINDVFRAYFLEGIPILHFELQIFDRWGNKIFETFDQNGEWNGEYASDKASENVFVYQCKIVIDGCIDGETSSYKYKGDVQVIR